MSSLSISRDIRDPLQTADRAAGTNIGHLYSFAQMNRGAHQNKA